MLINLFLVFYLFFDFYFYLIYLSYIFDFNLIVALYFGGYIRI
jgi:hypothetical protein